MSNEKTLELSEYGGDKDVSGSVRNVHLSSYSKTVTFPGARSISGLPLEFDGDRPIVDPAVRPVLLCAKRTIDIVFSLSALIVLAPLLAFVALTIKLTSPGAVLFSQKREGLNGQPIELYKFRSMYIDRCDITGTAQTVADDPRITPIGRFIRRTSIDELPQLINVLKGDMSIIGPRPHAFNMLAGGKTYNELVPYYALRQAMKPGLSGWAQVNGYRGPTDDARVARARIDHDLAYIQNFSLILDFRITIRTLVREISGGSGN